MKPKKKSIGKHYDYNDIIDYIEKKYNIETRGYKEEIDGEYRDFWHWFVDRNDIHNGCFARFPEDWENEDEWWVKEIMTIIEKEFFPNKNDSREVWVEW